MLDSGCQIAIVPDIELAIALAIALGGHAEQTIKHIRAGFHHSFIQYNA
jgi:hypothetical protein